mmetsp:Transcript_63181/g.174703  ORF Transcript_63181/g.174703 Transcript_63181/m.174703 type:complete len:314 (-) Transcript_63181:1384-2325(-)
MRRASALARATLISTSEVAVACDFLISASARAFSACSSASARSRSLRTSASARARSMATAASARARSRAMVAVFWASLSSRSASTFWRLVSASACVICLRLSRMPSSSSTKFSMRQLLTSTPHASVSREATSSSRKLASRSACSCAVLRSLSSRRFSTSSWSTSAVSLPSLARPARSTTSWRVGRIWSRLNLRQSLEPMSMQRPGMSRWMPLKPPGYTAASRAELTIQLAVTLTFMLTPSLEVNCTTTALLKVLSGMEPSKSYSAGSLYQPASLTSSVPLLLNTPAVPPLMVMTTYGPKFCGASAKRLMTWMS